ncbi:MAG: hypothetical protein COV01_03905 [Candidatus Taylorbacteria bacterium CG10_big_fil_rev_8_21_14_0_10_41_48]|uniref:Uncharacterized protein n=1 Tax=Candidatus Taylorbacteria bacterium CG10_big_fil_rev_8_21_14_0_10_41_48 TaxID=1975024 RepID=A0A2M8LB22_9BACT|nr:MAG: hypothetical protein COV01_03905 [Candidatus Taylorbacteria bacterium CG10_big_fil_rev_8_21_14_0_10_41_48]
MNVDYNNRYDIADQFSKKRPSFEEVLEFGRRPKIGFSNWVEDGKIRFGNSADSEGVLMALIGERGFNRVIRQLKKEMIGTQISVKYVAEVDGKIVVTARSQWEDWSEETDDEGNSWRETQFDHAEATLRGRSGKFESIKVKVS